MPVKHLKHTRVSHRGPHHLFGSQSMSQICSPLAGEVGAPAWEAGCHVITRGPQLQPLGRVPPLRVRFLSCKRHFLVRKPGQAKSRRHQWQHH